MGAMVSKLVEEWNRERIIPTKRRVRDADKVSHVEVESEEVSLHHLLMLRLISEVVK